MYLSGKYNTISRLELREDNLALEQIFLQPKEKGLVTKLGNIGSIYLSLKPTFNNLV